ncbi:CynX/NimT family MFS transporter [Aeromicrobium sp.]|uniref:MFS transporter n=1 Tax=Aeromicrobium sp. TaxID=1871063 RepID=UPI003C6322CF
MPRTPTSGRLLVAAAIVLLALNLRVAIGSLGVVLSAVRADLGMSTAVGGIVTTIPVVCFAVFGVGAHGVVKRLGLHRTAALVLTMLAIGLVLRALADSTALFLACTTFALAGAAMGNIILPPLVKAHFPDRIALMSALYGAALMAGATLGSIATVPLSDVFGGWRQGLGLWAALCFVALLPWLAFLRSDVKSDPSEGHRLPLGQVSRSPLTWAMALLFGAQSAGAYAQFGWFPEILTDAGLSDAHAGAMLGLLSGVGIPLTLGLPWLMRIIGDRPTLPLTFAVLTAGGWLGVLLAPTTATWLWAVLLGLGGGSFTWTLTMIGKRTRTTAGTTTLSVFTQGPGYLIAGIGPLGAGILHDVTGTWTTSIIGLIGLAGVIAVAGSFVARPVMLEDTLKPSSRDR